MAIPARYVPRRSGFGQARPCQRRQARPALQHHRAARPWRSVKFMAFLDTYRQQVTLLIRILPSVAEDRAFALKGGTAINMFVREMPRLSVDIDLTYLPVEDRATSLAAINAAMLRIKERIERGIPAAKVIARRRHGKVDFHNACARSACARFLAANKALRSAS